MTNPSGRIAGIARITIADVLRQRSFVVLVLLCVLFVFMMRGCWGTRMMINGREMGGAGLDAQVLKAVFVFVSAAVMLIAGLLAMRAFRRDREEGMQAFILSKPVPRLDYLIGKIAGLWVLLTAFMLVLHGAVFFIHVQHSGALGAGCIAASAISALNVLFVILAVSVLSLLLPEIFAFLAVFGVTAGAFVFDGIAQASRSGLVQSMLAQAPAGEPVTWWRIVYWVWPKAGALESAAASFLDPAGALGAGDLLIPIASIAAWCLVCWVVMVVRFEREEIA